ARLSELLSRRFGARLLLVGRTSLDGDPAASERLSSLEAAARAGSGDVRYEVADVADPAALAAAVERAEARWGCPLDGVVHLAGVLAPRLLAEETEESFTATLRPKVRGGLAIQALLELRP